MDYDDNLEETNSNSKSYNTTKIMLDNYQDNLREQNSEYDSDLAFNP